MTDKQAENTAQHVVADSIEAMPFSVGSALREARVRHGLSVHEVSQHLKFAPRQIEALEADDFAQLPEPAFVRGFVRSYARLLQLDTAPLLAALPHAPEQIMLPQATTLAEVPYPNIYTERKQNIIWLAAAFAVVIALVIAAWLLGDKQDKQKEQKMPEAVVSGVPNTTVETLALPETVPVSAVPETESRMQDAGVKMEQVAEVKAAAQVAVLAVQPAAKSVANSPAGSSAIRMTFDADSWVKITDKNGKLLLSQLNHAGTEQGVDGSPPFSLIIGQAKSVHLYYKGQPVDLAPHTNIEVARLTLE